MEKKEREKETHSLIISLADLIQDESKEKIVGAGRASHSHTAAWLIPSTRRGWWKKRGEVVVIKNGSVFSLVRIIISRCVVSPAPPLSPLPEGEEKTFFSSVSENHHSIDLLCKISA